MRNTFSTFGLLICLILISTISCQKQKTNDGSAIQNPNLEAVTKDYQLQPDKRFTEAVAVIHNFISGKTKTNVRTFFKNGIWKISYAEYEVGTLPEFPDFPDYLSMLERWVSQLNGEFPLQLVNDTEDKNFNNFDTLLAKFHTSSAARVANEVGELWKKSGHNSKYLLYATRGLVTLNLQQLDEIELADYLRSRAIAFLAITKSLTTHNVDREASMLSYTLGYSNYAVKISRRLPASDPIYLYVNNKDTLLMQNATGSSGGSEARYLYLLRLVSKRDFDGFQKWIEAYYGDDWNSLLIYNAGITMRSFGLSPYLAEALPRAVLINIGQEAATIPAFNKISATIPSKPYSDEQFRFLIKFVDAALKAKSSTLMNSFESGLTAFDKIYSGPFLDAEAYKSFYRGYFFSSYYIEGLHYLDKLSSTDAAGFFAQVLGNSGVGTAADLQKWYSDLVQSKSGQIQLSSLVEDLGSLKTLGAPPRYRIMDELEKYFTYGSPEILFAIKQLTPYLDTRPSHIVVLNGKVYTGLLDLPFTEKLCTALLKTSDATYPYAYAWYAKFIDSTQMIRTLLDSSTFDMVAKMSILSRIEQNTAFSKNEVKTYYNELWKANPQNWQLSNQYGKYLTSINEYQEARTILNDWLSRKIPTDGLEVVLNKIAIAQSYYEEKKYEEGWPIISDAAQSWHALAMEVASNFLCKMGRTTEAEKMARNVLLRYPDNLRSRLVLTSLFWEQGRYSDAAQLLNGSPRKIGFIDWRWKIAPKFLEIFSEKPSSEILAAISAIQSLNQLNPNLITFAHVFEEKEKYNISFLITSQLRGSPQENIAYALLSYRYLKAIQGKNLAIETLKKRIPPQMLGFSSMVFFDFNEDDLLWDFIENPAITDGPDFVWLMRAASVVRTGMEKNSHWQELIDYYDDAKDGHYDVIGKYLVGLVSEDEAIALMKDPKKVCEVAYYLGLRAEAEGRYEQASNWYRASIETTLDKNGEYKWAFRALQKWQSQGKSLRIIFTDKTKTNS